jgi:hypothetical protein
MYGGWSGPDVADLDRSRTLRHAVEAELVISLGNDLFQNEFFKRRGGTSAEERTME